MPLLSHIIVSKGSCKLMNIFSAELRMIYILRRHEKENISPRRESYM